MILYAPGDGRANSWPNGRTSFVILLLYLLLSLVVLLLLRSTRGDTGRRCVDFADLLPKN